MARHLTEQVRSFAEVTSAIARGDLNQKIEIEVMGEMAELKETVNGASWLSLVPSRCCRSGVT